MSFEEDSYGEAEMAPTVGDVVAFRLVLALLDNVDLAADGVCEPEPWIVFQVLGLGSKPDLVRPRVGQADLKHSSSHNPSRLNIDGQEHRVAPLETTGSRHLA